MLIRGRKMTEKKLDHTKEWEKLSKFYAEKAKSQSKTDPFWYRHRCIEGLLSGITNDYN